MIRCPLPLQPVTRTCNRRPSLHDCYVHSVAAGNACEGYNVAGRWVDCDRTDPHGHGILADMLED